LSLASCSADSAVVILQKCPRQPIVVSESEQVRLSFFYPCFGFSGRAQIFQHGSSFAVGAFDRFYVIVYCTTGRAGGYVIFVLTLPYTLRGC
jgi:hypothetical protein